MWRAGKLSSCTGKRLQTQLRQNCGSGPQRPRQALAGQMELFLYLLSLFPKWPVSKRCSQNLEHPPPNLWPGAWVVQQSQDTMIISGQTQAAEPTSARQPAPTNLLRSDSVRSKQEPRQEELGWALLSRAAKGSPLPNQSPTLAR